MGERVGERASSDPTDVNTVYAHVDALLVARRAEEALSVADRFAATDPASFHAALLRAQCLLALERIVDAEQSWRAASAIEPDHTGCGVVGIRCAFNGGDIETAWLRAERLHGRVPADGRATYWFAVVAARTGRDQIAFDAIAAMRHADPVGELPSLTAAEVDLQIAVRRRRRRAPLAEQVASELLGTDPLDPRGHDLRRRATAIRHTGWIGRRDLAETKLRHIRDAARAGIQPGPGQLRTLTVEALGPVVLVALWGGGLFLGAPLAESYGVRVTIVVFVGWVSLYIATRRRTARVVAALPAAGRAQLLKPVVRTIRTCAVVMAALAVLVLLLLHPINQQHAVDLGFAKGKASTRTIVIQPTRTTGPVIREINIPAKVHPERAWSLMIYYSTAAAVTVFVAGLLAQHSRSLARQSSARH
jgi:hypothetical protein